MKTVVLKNINLVVSLLISAYLLVSVPVNQARASTYYDWPEYSPTVAYDYVDEYGQTSPPTQILDDITNDDGSPVGTYVDGWWCFRWGSEKNDLVTGDAWIPMLERFNEDFAYISDVMRWPRDKRAREGYYSSVYLFGSGLSTDNEPNSATGGWQGTTFYNGEPWPMVLASYVPVAAFDPSMYNGYQTGAMIHEGIHCILSSMPGCKNSCWFHEGGNTWLQGTMESQRAGNFSSLGWLSAGSAIAPFMPIECYSGWLQDGSFGGPCAQGVYQGDGICTWRNLLGGVQYSEAFPHAMEVILGPKSIAWVWRNAAYSGRVLQDLAEAPGGLGETQTRRLIQEYRARQAFCDFEQWSYAYRQLLHGVWGNIIQEEYPPYWIDVAPWIATCYAATTQEGSVLTPDALTLPGWSGANQIPLTVSSGATEASVTFNPMGSNMSCQLVYRDTGGEVHYGVPVGSGTCSIPLAKVRNNVIIAVVCNTDYIYHGESTRTAKYDYTLTMGTGITGPANIHTRWFAYNPARYTLTASAGDNGAISPGGNVSVSAGGSQMFTFIPDPGYKVDEVLLNGVGIGRMDSYTFNNVRGDMAISVTFNLLEADEEPPTPNPAAWASEPAATGADAVTMTAATGVDASGPVEYYFKETSGHPGGSDSGWQSSPTYTDTGLPEMTQYTYKVWMRDSLGNKGGWSTSESAATSFTGEANIAVIAALDTSHVSPWETLEAINNEYTPARSSDKTGGAYGNWNGEVNFNTWNWVEYDFGAVYRINSTDVYWWVENPVGGIDQPYNAYIQYWNGGSWIYAGNIGVAKDRWNTLDTSFSTSKMRINMIGTRATGILEWRVWGEANQPPSFTAGTFSELDAVEDAVYSSTIADDASDPESDSMTFSKLSGPAWLNVASNGMLSGTPNNSNVGENIFTVKVAATGGSDTAAMTIQVANIYSGKLGMEDLVGLAAEWLTTVCGTCYGADLDGDHKVTLADFELLGQNWLAEFH